MCNTDSPITSGLKTYERKGTNSVQKEELGALGMMFGKRIGSYNFRGATGRSEKCRKHVGKVPLNSRCLVLFCAQQQLDGPCK
jgi:hypothetical protein